MQNNFAIVIPSYNENKNLSILIKKIGQIIPKAKIIIVDDSSFKENQKLKKMLAEKREVVLISRLQKLGRGSAVLTGFKEGLKDKTINYFFEMDADLAHDPLEIQRFIDRIGKKDYALIIGSRYIQGGKIINISKNRRFLSKLINKFLYVLLQIPISDYSSGFRLYNRRAVEFLLTVKIRSKGFITLSEIAYKLYSAGFLIAEVPITCNARTHGKSNLNLKELFSSLLFVLKMRFTDNTKPLLEQAEGR